MFKSRRACKVTKACCGGVTHWLLTPDDDDKETGEPAVMTVAWGQNAANGIPNYLLCFRNLTDYEGELGLGPEEPKSATKPTRHMPLVGVNVIECVHFIPVLPLLTSCDSIAAGQNTTLFLAKPTGKYSDLPRHPIDVDPPEACIQCGEDQGDDGDEVLECEKVCARRALVSYCYLISMHAVRRSLPPGMSRAPSREHPGG